MNKKSDNKNFSVALFTMYLAMLTYFLFFAESMGRDATARAFAYNLIPFKEIMRFIKHADKLGPTAVWLNLAGNVVAFIPFGYFVTGLLSSGRKVLKAVAYTVIFSLGVELIQLFSHVGSFDVDDIILNTLGGIIGSVVCVMLQKNSNK